MSSITNTEQDGRILLVLEREKENAIRKTTIEAQDISVEVVFPEDYLNKEKLLSVVLVKIYSEKTGLQYIYAVKLCEDAKKTVSCMRKHIYSSVGLDRKVIIEHFSVEEHISINLIAERMENESSCEFSYHLNKDLQFMA